MLTIFVAATNKENIRCYYIPEREQLLFSDGATITARQDSNGMFILDSALSTKLESENDNVQLELSLTEVVRITPCDVLIDSLATC